MSIEETSVLRRASIRFCLSLFPIKKEVAGLLVLALFSVLPAVGATITVSNTNDSGPGSLRQAIADAAPGDTIDFSVTGTITLTSGALSINKNLTITGPGASSLAISGNNSSRVFVIDGGITASISGVTIANGFAPPGCCQVGTGAGIANGGTLTLANTIVSNNVASDSGGGIVTGGTLILTNSTVSSNSAGSNGGGIYNTGVTQLHDSLVSGNSAGQGSGIWSDFGTLTLINSTVSSNTGDGIANGRTVSLIDSTVSNNSGSGIVNGGTGTLTNSTFSNNNADGIVNHFGALMLTNSTISGNGLRGILNNVGTLTMTNSTVAGNLRINGIENGTFGTLAVRNSIMALNGGGNCRQNGTAISHGHNLSSDGSCSSFFTATGDLNGAPAGLDPAGLQNNGGPTQTIALLSTSPAVDHIPVSPTNDCTAVDGTTPIATDQRGVPRPQASGCDIGAYELVQDDEGPITSNVQASPSPVAIDTATTLTANVDDTATGGSDIASAEYTIDGGPPNPMDAVDGAFDEVAEDVTASVAPFAETGVYSLCVRGTDVSGNEGDPACVLLPVYDPTGGFVTGGGIVYSPAGTDLANSSAEGLAKFGFVSKYLPGRTIPDGNLEFQFQAGNLNFKSSSMEWLVVTGQPRAIFRGEGTINATTVCKFEVDAWDASFAPDGVDAFGLKIFACTGGGDRYSLPATPLTKGSIIIHQK